MWQLWQRAGPFSPFLDVTRGCGLILDRVKESSSTEYPTRAKEGGSHVERTPSVYGFLFGL